MLNKLLKIRLLQIQRELRSVGFFYIFVILAFLAIVVYKFFYRGVAWTSDFYVALGLLFIIASIHLSRNDKKFLATIFHEKTYRIYLTEYFWGSLMFVIPLILGTTPWVCLIIWVGIFLVSLSEKSIEVLPLKHRVWLGFMIPLHSFEWRAGMRKMQFIIIPLYLIVLALCFEDYAGFWMLGILTFCFSVFYDEFEPIDVLLLNEITAKEFVRKKWKSEIGLFLTFISPILALYSLKYPERWYVFLPLVSIYLLNYSVFVFNKYKSYIPAQKNQSNVGIMALMFMGNFLPYLFPISIILIFVFYRKAIKKLSPYLDANH
jgi:hypothetical protein